ncbi:gliding motility-associated C-terminal domain-containing protein [Phaeocystidibacter luteus]|uniref:Gliding motility-associated C-terminal domain-containing protein n=1 Tax=Phaeocystidibacter luteus TaxID=911197 RepID=A0A6N6REU0_9FLAO|nr:gliding motility-associated C-terminal domain-containing protein [Phaeocystidibacter luteus]KAB2808686.1 gliding motility-associated C-terminal domain-containing protein [Phaeocystidibacter luteus]
MKLLKSLLLFAFVLTGWSTANASHIIGGDIQYEYLGNNQYYIKLVLYRNFPGIQLGPNQTVYVRSATCGGAITTINLPRTAQFMAAGNTFGCISQQSAGFQPEVNIYETTVSNPLVLTQNCTDYKISWNECCKPPGITNIGTGNNSATLGFYFEAELNRRQGLGNNSSPIFTSDPLAYICEGGTFIYTQNAVESDGDSLQYELINPRESDFNSTNVRPIPYKPPFSVSQPFTVDPANPYTLDPQTGNITFTAKLPPGIQREVSIITVRVNEYRFDSTFFIWEKIGSSNREIQVIITDQCLPAVNAGVRLDPNAPGTYLDPDGKQVRDYNCGDTAVTMTFTLPIECFSVAADGTDFRITAPNGQPIPVKKAIPYCDGNSETDSVTLSLYKPLIFNGDYMMYTKVGTDGNTLLNRCGKPMAEFDTIILRVSGCLDPVYDAQNVTVTNDEHNFVQWGLDTNTLPEQLVDFIRVFRSDDGGAIWSQVGTASIQDSGYTDYTVGPNEVDAQSYRYQVQFVANGQDLFLTRGINSIHLGGALNQNDQVPMNWTSYNGWTGASYVVQLGIKTGQTYNWSDVTDVNLPTLDSSYTFNASALSQGSYALRVQTTDGSFTSESNWITFGIQDPPVIPDPDVALIIPNLFTPGEDDINSLFTIQGIEAYNRVELVVYNRWGTRVYQNSNYTNSNAWDGRSSNGSDLAEGTYFYVLNATGGPNGTAVEENGSITLMRD